MRWRGGQADQLIDERHAGLGMLGTVLLQGHGWEVIPEVTFQRYGERGSIDLFATRSDQLAVCIVELKSGVYSYEETQRRLDVKARLASDIAWERLGWRPRTIGIVLVVEDTSVNRRRLKIDRFAGPGRAADARPARQALASRPGREDARAPVPVPWSWRDW